MKIKNLVLGLMVMGSLTMVGCNDVKDTSEALRNQPTKKVEDEVDINKEENVVEEPESQEPITQKEAEELIRDIYKKYGEDNIELSLHGESEDGITDDGNFYMFSKDYDMYTQGATTIIKVNRFTKEVLYVSTNTYITDRATTPEDKPLEQHLKEMEEYNNPSEERCESGRCACKLCGEVKEAKEFGEWKSEVNGTVHYACKECIDYIFKNGENK